MKDDQQLDIATLHCGQDESWQGGIADCRWYSWKSAGHQDAHNVFRSSLLALTYPLM